MEKEIKKDSLTKVSAELYNVIFQQALKNPLQGLFLTHYKMEEILEMETKMVLVKNKKGQLKLAGMAIKDYQGETESGEMLKEYNEDGTTVKEATALFSVDFSSIDKSVQDKLLNELNSIVIEPKNYGKDGEPNLILALLQQGILNTVSGKIKGSHFGNFLSEQYQKMGKNITNEDGWDFNYDYLSEEAKTAYIEYIKVQVSKHPKYKTNSSMVNYDPIENEIYIRGEKIKNGKDLISEINSKLKYYETVVNKESIEFYRYGKLIKRIIEKDVLNFDKEKGFTLEDFIKNTSTMSYKDMLNYYDKQKTKQKKSNFKLKN